jgi:hypothetical protein
MPGSRFRSRPEKASGWSRRPAVSTRVDLGKGDSSSRGRAWITEALFRISKCSCRPHEPVIEQSSRTTTANVSSRREDSTFRSDPERGRPSVPHSVEESSESDRTGNIWGMEFLTTTRGEVSPPCRPRPNQCTGPSSSTHWTVEGPRRDQRRAKCKGRAQILRAGRAATVRRGERPNGTFFVGRLW